MTNAQVLSSPLSADALHKVWEDRGRFLWPASLGEPGPARMILLYNELLDFCVNREGRGWKVYEDLFTKLGVEHPATHTEELFSNPPQLILTSAAQSQACNVRTEHLHDYIFLESDIWATWEGFEDPACAAALSVCAAIKATICHELAHTAVSRALRTMSYEPSSSNTNSPKEVFEIHQPIAQSTIDQIATLRTPWNHNLKGEAGEWAEYMLFGGILHLDIKALATLQTGERSGYLLTYPPLQLAHREVLVNFAQELPQLESVTISPSDFKWRKTDDEPHQPRVPQKKCPGSLFELRDPFGFKLKPSAATIEGIHRFLAEHRLKEATESPEKIHE